MPYALMLDDGDILPVRLDHIVEVGDGLGVTIRDDLGITEAILCTRSAEELCRSCLLHCW